MNSTEGDSPSVTGECPHYNRGCSLVSPCCGKVYECRLCHDDKELSHPIDRYAVKEIVCRKCFTRQTSETNSCSKCGLVFGKYFCSVCHFYDNNDKGQFHCKKCGLCRIGGKDNYVHCDKCGLCISKSMLDSHACRQDSAKDNCPVCMEDIHTSRDPAFLPNCGHLLHMSCYKGLLSNGMYRCPQCQTSLANMNDAWEKTDHEISMWEMPPHLKDFKVKIMCSDCHKESDAVFHILGLKCTNCKSYNTVRNGNEEIPQDAVPVHAEEFMAYIQERNAQGDDTGAEDSNHEED